MHILAEF
jgi:quinol monooxygenase YgiN